MHYITNFNASFLYVSLDLLSLAFCTFSWVAFTLLSCDLQLMQQSKHSNNLQYIMSVTQLQHIAHIYTIYFYHSIMYTYTTCS